MDIRIKPKKLAGSVPAISSKSDAHRLLIASALSAGNASIHIDCISQDIQATLDCIKAMGTRVNGDGCNVQIGEIDRTLHTVHLDANESGSTARFLLPIAAALYENVDLTGKGSLLNRPFEPLVAALREHGTQITRDSIPISARGQMRPGAYKIAGNVSSQFITGLLFALPLLCGDSEIILTTPSESRGYIEMTLRTLRAFGITATPTPGGFFVPGNQLYTAPDAISCEGDWSNAAFWLTAGALGERVSVSGLFGASAQADSGIGELLDRFGALVSESGDKISVSPAPLHAVEVCASDIPDLVPILSVAACAADGVTVIYGASRLRMKESDRLETVKSMLTALGGDVTVTEDGLIIHGMGRLKGGEVSGAGDHRIVMAAAIASVISDGDIIIRGAEAANKSYPRFFDDFKKLGGSFDVI